MAVSLSTIKALVEERTGLPTTYTPEGDLSLGGLVLVRTVRGSDGARTVVTPEDGPAPPPQMAALLGAELRTKYDLRLLADAYADSEGVATLNI